MSDDISQQIAQKIWDEEQVVQKLIVKDPLNPHLSGILRGLTRARDIANGVPRDFSPMFADELEFDAADDE